MVHLIAGDRGIRQRDGHDNLAPRAHREGVAGSGADDGSRAPDDGELGGDAGQQEIKVVSIAGEKDQVYRIRQRTRRTGVVRLRPGEPERGVFVHPGAERRAAEKQERCEGQRADDPVQSELVGVEGVKLRPPRAHR